jgi:predicted Zn finger-like uncharacterized protein
MPITLNCPKCHKPFRVRDESIGGRVRCPSCGSVLQVPAALSPASHFDEPPRAEASDDPSKPMAEEVTGRANPIPTMPQVAVGGPSSHEGVVDLRASGGSVPVPPPSIRASSLPSATKPPERASANVPPPSAPPQQVGRSAPPRPLSDEEATWASVRKGLGMIRLALFLFLLLILAMVGQAVWTVMDQDRAWSDNPGVLGRADWPLKKEVFAAYTLGLTIPAALLLLVGRLRCSGAPPESHARGMAQGAAFLTFVAIAGIAVFLALTFFNLGDKIKLPPEKVRLTGLYAAIPSAVLADILTLLFIGQIGWTLRRPALQKIVAGFFVYALFLPAAILIGEQYYPVFDQLKESWGKMGPALGGPEDDLAQRAVIWAAVILAAVILLILRYAGVAGRARRAIRNFLPART